MYANGAAVQPGPSGSHGPTSFKMLRAVIEVQRDRGCEPAGAAHDPTVATTKDSLPVGDARADAQPGMVSLTISDDAVGGKPSAMDPCALVHGNPDFVAHILQTWEFPADASDAVSPRKRTQRDQACARNVCSRAHARARK